MPTIQCLDSHVADLIAAGEVVERPASVAKELLENALDAGASAVSVEVQHGGLTYLRITDNGCGIAPSQLPTAFLRHATSKLRRAEDLAAIGTLGFRGEALAAISAVSRVDIFSRERGAEQGAALHLEGGVPGEVTETGCPEGTTICVRDLFYNTPARMKFMKKDTAEGAAVTGVVTHLALSHPEVSVKLIRDGAEVLHTPGDGQLRSAIYAALGRDFALGLLPVSGCGGDIQVEGFVTKPLNGGGTRARQLFFVNGRFVKSQLLTAALEEAYRNRLLKGKFPGCVLHITLPKNTVDVNVHPAKTVVKFQNERAVFDAVHYTVKDLLTAGETPAPKPVQQTFYQSMTVQQYKERQTPPPAEKRPLGSYAARPAVDPDAKLPIRDSVQRPATLPARDPRPIEPRPAPAQVPTQPESSIRPETPPTAPAFAPAEEKPAPAEASVPETPATAPRRNTIDLPIQQTLTEKPAPWRMVGEALDTYIICQDENENLWLIDKHAAHERLRFNALKERQEPPMSQLLLQPLAVDLEADAYAAALAQLPLLEEFGFSCEDFGAGTLLVRQIPADIRLEDAAATVEELAEDLRLGRADPGAARDRLLQTMACKSAIKAGMHTAPAELRALVDRVQSGEIQYCPHGRPVAVKLTRYEIEKMFKRA